MNSGVHVLNDALGDPHEVSDLLLLHLQVSPEHAVVELLGEGRLAQLQLVPVQHFLDHLLLVRIRQREEPVVGGIIREHFEDLFKVFGKGQVLLAVGVEPAELAEEALLVVVRELRPHAVQGDGDGPPVRLKGQEGRHHFVRGPALLRAEGVEVLNPRLVQHVPHDLQVHLRQILPREAPVEVLPKRRVNQDQLVELLHIGGNCE
mmetsp:Transcript_3120/g.8282  ORF Transcript_3120/g.8282 Transcript_3120/m.8282 type:complete len:205 (-) Transcript_3120:509-1123(-)